ncbi:unnamed protein product [Phytomonas sp. Hart1]|nr:unnamed protein product [Phytomonas sp. Hart1]|eukprot:CCW68272.1 unnamed protein product [Phytomonas sp. isolate Hart1]
MSQHWTKFIDQTLHSTNDTIRRLKERQAHYEAAKKRVNDAFENSEFTFSSTAPRVNESYRNVMPSSKNEIKRSGSSARVTSEYTNGSQMRLPPPLPPSVIDYALFGEETHTNLPLSNSEIRRHSYSSREDRDLAEAYRVVEMQLKNVTAELELVHTIHKDRERELSDRFSKQNAEINSSLKELKMENDHLKDSMRILESRQAQSNPALHDTVGALSLYLNSAAHSQSAFGAKQPLKDFKPQASSRGFNLPYVSPVEASVYSAGAASDHLAASSLSALFQRVGDLETSARQHQKALETRQHQMGHTIHEAVENKINLEIERVRSVAREAACASTESLIQLRLSAVQTMFNDELRKVLESAAVARELSEGNERLFRKWEQKWSNKWLEMEDRMQGVEKFTQTVRESLSSDLQKSLEGDINAVRQEFTTLRRETQDGRARLAQEIASKIESGRLDVMSTVQNMLSEQHHQEGFVQEAVARRLIESALQPLHTGLENAQHGLQSLRESNEAWRTQTLSRLGELEEGAEGEKLKMAEVRQTLALQPAVLERIRAQVKESTQKQQQLDADFHELHAAASDAIDVARGRESQDAEQRAHFEGDLRRLQQAQEGQSKRLHIVETAQDAQRQHLEQVGETVGSLEVTIGRSLPPTTQKLNTLQQTVHQTCLPQIESLQHEMLAATTRSQQLHDGRTYHEKLVGQLLVDVKKDAEARMQDIESRMRQDLEEAQLRWKTNLGSHAALLTPITKSVETLMTKASLSENAQNSMSESIQRLEANVATLEASASSDADVKCAVSQSSAALLSKKIQDLEMGLRAREADDPHGLTVRLDLLDSEQQRLGQNVVALQDQLYEAVGKIKHETQLHDVSLKEYAMATVSKSEHRTLEHINSTAHRNEEWLKELIHPSCLVQRIVMESSVLGLLARSIQPHLGLSDEKLASIDAMSEALRIFEQQQVELKRGLEALKDDSQGGGKKAKAFDNESSGGALLTLACGSTSSQSTADAEPTTEVPKPGKDRDLLLEQIRLENAHLIQQLKELPDNLRHAEQHLKEQILQSRTASEEATSSLLVKVAALEAQGASLTDTYAQLHKSVGNRLQAAQEATEQAHAAAFQQLRAGVRRLEESHTTLAENHGQLAEAVRKVGAEGEQGGRMREALTVKLAGLEGLVVTRLEEVYRDMIEWHQNQLATLEQRLARRAVEEDSRWGALREEIEQRTREVCDAHVLTANSTHAKGTRRGDDAQDRDAYTRVELLEGSHIALEQKLWGVVTSNEVGLKATADALTGLRDSLQHCVSCVVQELQNDSLMLRIVKGGNTPGSSLVIPGQREINENNETLPKLEALDQVFVLLMRQFSYVCHGLSTLQENAFATLELVQQQEMSILAIPTLQEAFLQLASQMRKVSMALPELGEWDVGIEEMIQSTILKQQDTVVDEQSDRN